MHVNKLYSHSRYIKILQIVCSVFICISSVQEQSFFRKNVRW